MLRFEYLCGSIVLLLAALTLSLPAGASAASRSTRAGKHGCYGTAAAAASPIRFSPAPHGSVSSITLKLTRYRKPVLLTQAPACASKVIVGHSYRASLRYRSTTSAISLRVLAHTRRGWHVWYSPKTRLQARKQLTSVSVLLNPIQGGVDRIAFGVLVRASGVVQGSSFSLVDASLHPGAGTSGSSVSGGPLAGIPSNPIVAPPVVSLPVDNPPVVVPPGGASVTGEWSVSSPQNAMRSVHAILLQSGKLLLMAGSGNDPMAFAAGTFKTFLYDPATGASQEILTPTDVFCSGHVQLANGNVLILGGTKDYPQPVPAGQPASTVYHALAASYIFNIHTNTYERINDLLGGHYDVATHTDAPEDANGGAWYPSATELGNGDVISFGGLDASGQGQTKTNYFVDPSNPDTGDTPGEWVGFGSTKLQQTYPWYWGEYPSMILTADGRLFYDGSHVFGNGAEGTTFAPSGTSLYKYWCDPNANQAAVSTNPDSNVSFRVQDTAGLRDPDMRDQSASLLLPPAQHQKVMIMGGGNTYTTIPGSQEGALNLTDEIDLSQPNPHWVAGPNLPRGTLDDGSMQPLGAGKMYVSAVALPDGKVLETGGSQQVRSNNVHEASIFDPATDAFTPVAPDPVGRDYHSEALLLPDGRVITLGSNPFDPSSGQSSFELRVSIYKPPYLFKGARPVLSTIDGQANASASDGTTDTKQWAYGTQHTLGYTSAKPITSAVLIRPGAVTHSSDPNQRELSLPISADASGQLMVSLTANQNLAPPGYYMVFLLNSDGVPSVAQWVHVGAQGAPGS
ncbi:MAG TPA: galactose oxidase early set domain-containing protein [Solirubrobacteraceae bacterium]|nr:galactose oxidase early set domain-containing protein [Solirubrobacteraceae bacterium]